MTIVKLTGKYSAKVEKIWNDPNSPSGEHTVKIGYYQGVKSPVKAGELELVKDGNRYLVSQHYIQKEHRGQGLGRQVIKSIARRTGMTISSDADHSTEASKMWEALGAKKMIGGNYEYTSNATKRAKSPKVKGWTDEARRAALLKRKRKAKVTEERRSEGSSKLTKGTVPSHGELEPIKKNKAGEHILANGKKLPKHIPKIPPAWTNVQVNVNPNANLWVKGMDEKGRSQSVYNPTFSAKNAAKKFTKVNELRKKKDQILNELRNDMKKPATREVSIVLALINHTGIRPGSSKDTKAAKQAYGATTLRAEHVRDGGTRLKFTGKKGVSLDIKVTDPTLVKVLAEKAKLKGKGEKLFDVDDAKLREYTHSKDGGGFNPKDFRTAKGTEAAIAAMAGLKPPRNEAEYKKLIKKVATEVSKQLGNTPTIALQSYIDPTVFASWRIK